MANEKQSSEMKAFIMKTARELIWEKGYDKTSMRDIARACSYEPSNTYNYFSSKEQLLYELLEEETGMMISMLRGLEHDDTSSPLDQLRYIIRQHVELAIKGKMVSGLMFDVELRNLSADHEKKIIEFRDRYEGILHRVIRRGIDAGYFVETNERLVTIMIISMIVRSRVWFSPKGEKSPEEIADFITRFTLNSLLKDGKKKPGF
ncbi:MAG: TetR family transcriptional regulator [Dehalococcoidia bacterium]|nr:TetR family transcriptional regulator [Dehalococcoidia bacterium]